MIDQDREGAGWNRGLWSQLIGGIILSYWK